MAFKPKACLNEMESASTVIGNDAGTGKDGAHHVQPLIQNVYAPEQRSGWVERGRGLVGWEGLFFLMTEAMHM